MKFLMKITHKKDLLVVKCLRKKYNLKQSDLGNAGQVSQVEKGGI